MARNKIDSFYINEKMRNGDGRKGTKKRERGRKSEREGGRERKEGSQVRAKEELARKRNGAVGGEE